MEINESTVNKILKKNKSAVQLALIKNATEVAKNAVNEIATNKQREVISMVAFYYTKQYAEGGSYCPDPNNLGKAIKVNWLDERYDKAKEDIMNYLKEYDGSKNPIELAKDISGILDSDIDAKRMMRTETEKIRTATKVATMRANNTKYVRYVAVMDDRVRPEHAALDGQIFPIEEAPVLGEPNCRCTYVPATESEYDEQKWEYKEEYDVEDDWTAEKAQKWLESPDGRETGLQIATERARTIEEQRDLFRKTMKELEGEARLNVLKLNSYRPEWLEAQTDVIAHVPYNVFKVLEESTKVFPKIDIKVEQNYLNEGFAELYKANVDTCSEFFKDFPEAADFKKLTIKAGTSKGLFDVDKDEVTLYAKVMNGTLVTSVLLHETAHALKGMDNLYNTFFEMNPDVTLEDAPSKYGKTDRAEFSAECIADYYVNKGSAKPISKRFVAFAKEMMGKIRNR